MPRKRRTDAEIAESKLKLPIEFYADDFYEIEPMTHHRFKNVKTGWLSGVGYNTPTEAKIHGAAFQAIYVADGGSGEANDAIALWRHGEAFIAELVRAGIVIVL